MKKFSYKDAGVDIDKGDAFVQAIKPMVESTFRPEVLTKIGGFAGCVSLNLERYKKPILVSSTDGVGTKLKIAFMMDRHDTVGIDLVAMCVNDIVVGGAGYPKDSNLYQASRAPSYLFFAPVPVVRPGGFLIIPARCEEGAGNGVGEQRFLSAMRETPDVQYILDDARRSGYPPGQQRAFVMAKVLEQARVVIVGSECPELVAACKMLPAATMEEAFDMAGKALGSKCQVLIVPHALLTLPVIGN